METFKNVNTVYPKTRAQWRNWLQKNYTKQKAVWLITYNKNSGKPTLNYNDSVEEALCFGWIDSVKYKRDTESAYQYFGPRKPNSVWSKLNRDRVVKLKKAGLLLPAGQQMIDIAKKNGQWHALKEIEKLTIPEDLKKAFAKNKKAFQYFEAFSPSSKRVILYWIKSAKRTETREKRIAETVAKAALNKKAMG